MTLTVLIGGARSGKSRLAVELARGQPAPVVFLATATPGDEEMLSRIEAHRAERPPSWWTVEEPLALVKGLSAAGPSACLVVDCLSLWAANALEVATPADVEREAERAAHVAARRPGPTIAVTNEVGMGVVPATPLGRTYRDVLGRINATWTGAACRALLVVAGRTLELGRAEP